MHVAKKENYWKKSDWNWGAHLWAGQKDNPRSIFLQISTTSMIFDKHSVHSGARTCGGHKIALLLSLKQGSVTLCSSPAALQYHSHHELEACPSPNPLSETWKFSQLHSAHMVCLVHRISAREPMCVCVLIKSNITMLWFQLCFTCGVHAWVINCTYGGYSQKIDTAVVFTVAGWRVIRSRRFCMLSLGAD